MIYTVGNAVNYLRFFREQDQPQKMGRSNPDSEGVGGTVFETREEAEEFCLADHAVFGVDADWDKDTEEYPANTPGFHGGTGHELLRDADLIILRKTS